MQKHTRAVGVGAIAVIAVGWLTACSSGAQEAASPTSTVAPMPSSATFIADVAEKNGETMTMAVTVEGAKGRRLRDQRHQR
jgi:hypothetical protein